MPTPPKPGRDKAPVTTESAAAPSADPRFLFDRFVVQRVVFEELLPASSAPGAVRPSHVPTTINITLRVEMHEELAQARSVLTVETLPDAAWQPYRIEVVVVGFFREEHGNRSLLEAFCVTSAPSILFPYVRGIINDVTRDGAYGPVRLNPIGIRNLTPASLEPPAEDQQGPNAE
jgi:preprotein translocase subunit SecB